MQQADLEDIFDAGGSLARALKGFVPRRQQLHMAQRVADALEERRTLVIEAGTGTGKTFGYLVPVLLSGLRVLVSTGTRTLQDQLYEKDLPLLSGALGQPVHVAVLKGRGNYLCLHRLQQVQLRTAPAAPTGSSLGPPALPPATCPKCGLRGLASVVAADHLHARQLLRIAVSRIRARHLVRARREAQEAQVVIVNHHLLLADLTLKEDGFGDVLGTADAVVIDEAHQLPDLAMQFFGANCGARGLAQILNAVRAEATQPDSALKFALEPPSMRLSAA